MRTSSGRTDRFHDAVDDLIEVQVVGIDDHGVAGRFERRDRPLRVDPIPELDLSAHRLLVDSFTAAFELGGATPDLLVEARDQKEFVVGVGKDNRADIAARHDDALLAHAPLLGHERLAHAGDGRDDGQGVGVIHVVDAFGQLHAIRPHSLAIDADRISVGEPRHGLRVTRVDAALGCHPGDRPVHQPAIYKRKAELLRDSLADRGFARRHAPIDRDDHGSSRPVARRSAATSPSDSPRPPPVLSRPSLKGPNAVRRRETTLWPMAWTMRRTWRFLPSRITMRISARPESRAPLVARSISTSAGAVMPSSSLTPSRSVFSCLEAGTPATTTSYSLATVYRG